MALVSGSVSIDPTTGAVSGSGHARSLYDAEAAADPRLVGDLAAIIAAPPYLPPFDALCGPMLLQMRIGTAAKCNALAAAHVALIQSGTVTVSIPSTPYTATDGTIG